MDRPKGTYAMDALFLPFARDRDPGRPRWTPLVGHAVGRSFLVGLGREVEAG